MGLVKRTCSSVSAQADYSYAWTENHVQSGQSMQSVQSGGSQALRKLSEALPDGHSWALGRLAHPLVACLRWRSSHSPSAFLSRGMASDSYDLPVQIQAQAQDPVLALSPESGQPIHDVSSLDSFPDRPLPARPLDLSIPSKPMVVQEIVQDWPRFVEHEKLQGCRAMFNQKQATSRVKIQRF